MEMLTDAYPGMKVWYRERYKAVVLSAPVPVSDNRYRVRIRFEDPGMYPSSGGEMNCDAASLTRRDEPKTPAPEYGS